MTIEQPATYREGMRPLALLLLVAAVFAGAGCGSTSKTGSGPITPSASASGGLSAGRLSGLQFSYPRAYHARRFESCSAAVTGDLHGGCARGVVIASYRLRPHPEMGGSGARFSARGVALELYRPPADQGPASVSLGDRRLSLWQFNSVGDNPVAVKKPPPPEQWEAFFRVSGASYWAIAWVGTHAKKADRAKLAALIGSVHRRGHRPRAPSPRPAPRITHVLCGGTAGHPRVPHNALAGGSGSGAFHICAQVIRHTCRVWTRLIGAPAADVRERHLQLRKSFCRLARSFLRRNPRGYSVEQARPGLTALLFRPEASS